MSVADEGRKCFKGTDTFHTNCLTLIREASGKWADMSC